MATTAPPTREELLERYVTLSAIETFFERILCPRGRTVAFGLFSSAGLTMTVDECPSELHDLEREINELFETLFPDDESLGAVYEPARARARLAAARLFANAAGRSDVFAAEADALMAEVALPMYEGVEDGEEV